MAEESQTQNIRARIVAAAENYLNVPEEGGENRGAAIESFLEGVGRGAGENWCAAFISAVLRDASQGQQISAAFAGLQDNYATSQFRDEAIAANAYHEAGGDYVPQLGDLIYLQQESDRRRDDWLGHIAVVTDYNPETKMISFIGGNQKDKVSDDGKIKNEPGALYDAGDDKNRLRLRGVISTDEMQAGIETSRPGMIAQDIPGHFAITAEAPQTLEQTETWSILLNTSEPLLTAEQRTGFIAALSANIAAAKNFDPANVAAILSPANKEALYWLKTNAEIMPQQLDVYGKAAWLAVAKEEPRYALASGERDPQAPLAEKMFDLVGRKVSDIFLQDIGVTREAFLGNPTAAMEKFISKNGQRLKTYGLDKMIDTVMHIGETTFNVTESGLHAASAVFGAKGLSDIMADPVRLQENRDQLYKIFTEVEAIAATAEAQALRDKQQLQGQEPEYTTESLPGGKPRDNVQSVLP